MDLPGFAGDGQREWICRRGFVGVDLPKWIRWCGSAGVDWSGFAGVDLPRGIRRRNRRSGSTGADWLAQICWSEFTGMSLQEWNFEVEFYSGIPKWNFAVEC